MRGAYAGDLTSLVPSIGVENLEDGVERAKSTILVKRFRNTGDAHCFKDTHGTLQPDYKACHELELWIPIKKWATKSGFPGAWSYNLYFSLLMELSGIGDRMKKDEAFVSFADSCNLYYIA